MISAPDRRKCVELIEEATRAGARCKEACKELSVSLRTYQRWTQEGSIKTDGRGNAQRPEPSNKLTPGERENILEICAREEYRSLPPSQIVPALADKNTYIASESSFYRVLREAQSGIPSRESTGTKKGRQAQRIQGNEAEPDLELGHHIFGSCYYRDILSSLPGDGHL